MKNYFLGELRPECVTGLDESMIHDLEGKRKTFLIDTVKVFIRILTEKVTV